MTIHINYRGDMFIKDGGGFESRHESTIDMFKHLYTYYNAPRNVTYNIHTGDFPTSNDILCYCNHPDYPHARAIPDFSFDKWEESKLPKFFEFHEKMKQIQPFHDKVDKLFWIGALFDYRKSIIDKYKDYKDFEFYSRQSKFVSLYDHVNYKYLLDMRGVGWSARLKFLLCMNSVVFVVDRKERDYWWDNFEPWVDYVPIKEDGSDLIEIFEKVKNNQDQCKSIAQSAYKKSRVIFDKHRVYSDFAKILSQKSGL